MAHSLPAVFVCSATLLGLFSPNEARCQGGYVGSDVTAPDIANHMGLNINTAHPVGAIAGVADVSDIGSASYTIPLYVAPGTNGMQPGLSIIYSSMGGDGSLGYGWAVGGLSAITRTGLDQYHDNAVGPVTLGTTSERFSLDGQRLMVTSGTDYFAADAHYDTESAQFNYCIAHGQQGFGPAYFTRVVKENGWTYEYGGGTPEQHAQVMVGGSSSVYMWLLNKVQDAFGNYMTFTYSQTDLHPRIERIDYTANANTNLASYNAVVFEYLQRADVNEVFIRNTPGIKTSKLLKHVTMLAEGAPFKQYQFNYCLRDHGKSFLREVIEVGADMTTTLNSTLVKYADMVAAPYEYRVTDTHIGNDRKLYAGDFDGDGSSEVLAVHYYVYSDNNVSEHVSDYMEIYDGDEDHGITQQPVWSASLGSSIVENDMSTSVNSFESNLSHDMNGDGRDDIISTPVTYYGNMPGNSFDYVMIPGNVNIHLSNSTAGSFNFALNTLGLPGTNHLYPTRSESATPWPLHPNFMMVGDFNGDGFGDILHPFKDGNTWHMRLLSPFRKDLNGNDAPLDQEVICGSSDNIGRMASALNVIVSDFDGDGASEVLMTWPTFSTIAKITSDYHMISAYNGGFPVRYESANPLAVGHYVWPLDFNGDGKTDLLTNYNQQEQWKILSYTGAEAGFVEMDISSAFADFYSMGNGNVLVNPQFIQPGDFNGDGKSDILVYKVLNNGTQPGERLYRVIYSRGSGVSPVWEDFSQYPFSMHVNHNWTSWEYSQTNFLMGPLLDLNGDGRVEMLNVAPSTAHIVSFRPNGHEQRVESVVDGLGNLSTFEWKYATDPTVHAPGSDFLWPNIDVNPPLPVVAGFRSSDGIGGQHEQSYAYGGAKLNRRGKGFLGFMDHTIADWTLNRVQIKNQRLVEDNIGFGFLTPFATQDFRQDNMELLSNSIINSAFVHLNDAARHLLRIESSSAYDALLDSHTITTNDDIGAHGEVNHSITIVGGGIEVTEVSSDFGTFGPCLAVDPSVPNRETLRTVQHQPLGSPPITTVTHRSYDQATAHLIDETQFYDSQSSAVTTTYEYWPTGNVKTKTVQHPNLNTDQRPIDRFTYESKFRFADSHTSVWNYNGNLIDVTEHIETHPQWGKPTSSLSADGLTTLMKYDGFGRLEETKPLDPFGTPRYIVTQSLDWALDGGLQVFSTTTNDPSGPDRTTIYDVLGRPVKTITESFGHTNTITELEYDSRGNVVNESSPHHDGEDFMVIGHLFDEYNRKKQDIHPLSGYTDYDYVYENGELTTTITSATTGQWSSTTVDATGHTISARDDGGELKYAYDGWGNPLHVWHDGLQVARSKYDAYGRQTELYAPNAGTTYYKYNPFGQLVWQKDANANEVSFKYDNLGRETKRTAPEGVTETKYFNVGGRINNNPVLIDGPIVDRIFLYNDPYNRLSSSTSVINGQSYVTGYEYDAYDRVYKQHYPSGLLIENIYADDGSLEQVVGPSGTLFNGLENNGLGQYTNYDLGDGNSIKKDYFHGYLKKIDGGSVQQLHMDYDFATGNMLYRWDATKGRKENFEYDALNRLTSSAIEVVDQNGQPTSSLIPTSYKYDGSMGSTRGNLTMRTDIGQLGYGTHAITAAKHIDYPTPYDEPPSVISQETQQLTYTPFLKTATINEHVGGDAFELRYEYGPEHQRTRSLLVRNNIQEVERIYVGGYEKQIINGSTEEIHYIPGGDGLCAIMVKRNGIWKTYTTYADHLGSIVAVTDVADGNVVAEQNFDPWGRHRKPNTWASDFEPQLPTWLYRGFTGHEHVAPFALINMNGRMYDPALGRMLGVDNYVNGSSATQAFNRCSYATNNPLKYTDPDGNNPLLIASILFAATSNWASHGMQWNAKGLGYAFVGAIAGTASYGIGAGVSAGLGGSAVLAGIGGTAASSATGFFAGATAGAAAGLVGGGIAGFGNSLVNEESSSEAGEKGVEGAWNGALSGAATGALFGGLDATTTGHTFFTGQLRHCVVQEFNLNGTITTQLSCNDMGNGFSAVKSYSNVVPRSRWFRSLQNPDGTWSTTLRLAPHLRGNGVTLNRGAGPATVTGRTGRTITLNTPARVTRATISGMKPYGLPVTGPKSLMGTVNLHNGGMRSWLYLTPLFSNW